MKCTCIQQVIIATRTSYLITKVKFRVIFGTVSWYHLCDAYEGLKRNQMKEKGKTGSDKDIFCRPYV